MASFRCYDNSDVIATLIITNFHLYLIQLWWQFFQIFVYGDVVYAQTWEVLTLDKLYRATLRNIAFRQRNRKNFVCELFICRFRFILFAFFSSKISRSIDGSEKYNRCVGYKKSLTLEIACSVLKSACSLRTLILKYFI